MDETGTHYDRGDIERIFKGSVPDEVYRKLLANPDALDPCGTELEFTVLFADIRRMTDLLEPLPLKEKQRLFGSCLEISEAAIVGNGGFLEKFVGDETMALFGVVGDQGPREQALAACRAALELTRGYKQLGVGVGVSIHRCLALIGNMGTRKNPYFTPFGDEIIFAANLEGQTKRFRHDIALGAPVADLVRGSFRVVPADSIRPREHAPRQAFALIGPEAELSASGRELWDRYEAAYAAIESGKIEEALTEFGSLLGHPDAIPFLGFAYDRARARLIEKVEAQLASATSLERLYEEASSVIGRVFGQAAFALAAPADDGTWRFAALPGQEAPQVILAPDGDVVVWLKGLTAAAVTKGPAGVEDRRACADPGPIPSAFADLPFGLVAPLRHRGEAVGAIMVAMETPSATDLALLGEVAERLSRPFAELSLASYRERYREKASAEERLSAANWELEAQSLELQRAMGDIRTLNRDLEARVKEQVERLERAFKLKRYLPPDLVEAVLEGKKRLEPSFERRKITVFFSDVRGFTAATDSIEPEELARLLNEYLSAMSEIAFRLGGTIDKFRGDGMMVLFGAPERLEAAESARRCASMAVEMCRATELLKAKWDDEGYDWDIGVRIGINTGYATVGEFGCEERMDFTAIGSEVNLASRLESGCEVGEITLSHASYALVKDAFPCAPRGEVALKGISRPIRVYELLWREAGP